MGAGNLTLVPGKNRKYSQLSELFLQSQELPVSKKTGLQELQEASGGGWEAQSSKSLPGNYEDTRSIPAPV